jgi:thiol-disulfide isomerase/thioredoxin
VITDDEIEQRLRSAFRVVADGTEIARDGPRGGKRAESEPVFLVLDNTATDGNTRNPRVLRAAAAILLVAVFAAAFLLSGAGRSDRMQVVEVPQAAAVPAASSSVQPGFPVNAELAKSGQPAPVISGVDFAGNPLVVADDGRPRVYVVLAPWCGYCQSAATRLVRLNGQNALDGITLYGVVSAATPAGANYPPADWLDRLRWPFPTFDDADNAIAKALGITALPYYVFVDARGNVAAKVTGDVSDADLVTLLRALAAGRPLPIKVDGWAPSPSSP